MTTLDARSRNDEKSEREQSGSMFRQNSVQDAKVFKIDELNYTSHHARLVQSRSNASDVQVDSNQNAQLKELAQLCAARQPDSLKTLLDRSGKV